MMLLNHRRCGCDCRDADHWEVDANIYNPLALLNSSCTATGGITQLKPPCKYLAKFECDREYGGEPVTALSIPLRVLCPFESPQIYRGILLEFESIDPVGFQNPPFSAFESRAIWGDACTISERYNIEAYSGFQGLHSALWDLAVVRTRWSLDFSTPLATFTHTSGIRYQSSAFNGWRCFDSNTLWLAPDTVPPGYPPMPRSVCIVPDIRKTPLKTGCCKNRFQAEIPLIETNEGTHIAAQRLDFVWSTGDTFFVNGLPIKSPYLALARVLAYNGTYGQTQGRCGARQAALHVMSAMGAGGQPASVCRLYIQYGCYAQFTAIYECSSFTCETAGTFNRITNDAGFPQTIQVTTDLEQTSYASDNDDRGPCPNACGDPTYGGIYYNEYSDTDYAACCDPFCDDVAGTVKINCPGSGGGISFNCRFTVGGHAGAGAIGPSREACFTFNDDDAVSHSICVVVYCNGSGWASDWYCDGTLAGTGSGGYTLCCPLRFEQEMPTMSCMEGCTGCVAINTPSTICQEPSQLCCDPPADPVTVSVGASGASCYPGPGSFTLPLTGTYRWSGDDDESTRWTLTCSGGVYTIHSPDNNINSLVETSHTCDPFQVNFVEDSGACVGQVITVTA